MQIDRKIETVKESIKNLELWIEEHNYKGYEPFDGLSSFLYPLAFKNVIAERILQQTVRQFPFNLRPIIGVKPLDSTKGRGYIAWGYLKMFEQTGMMEYREKAEKCLDWLIENKSSHYLEHSWGNHFDYVSRGGKLPKFEPTIVWTSIIGQVFLDAYEILEKDDYLNIAKSICQWILKLPKEKTDSGTCLAYTMYQESTVHNSNMLGAAMLARTGRLTNNNHYFITAKSAMEYSCLRQLESGAWYYGDESKWHWIDNFHTGYNLDSLKCFIDNSKDKHFEKNLDLGFQYFKNNFIENSGRPKYYHNRAYPIDIQCASQAIETLVNFSDYDRSSLDLAIKVASWTIKNMQDDSGFFYYRMLPWKKVKIPMLHWGQATMYKALALLLSKMRINVTR